MRLVARLLPWVADIIVRKEVRSLFKDGIAARRQAKQQAGARPMQPV